METVMRKEVNATRYLLIILLFFSFIKLYAQEELSGKYCIDYKMKDFHKCITFKNNNTFNITEGGDLGNTTSINGNWHLLGKTLILSYNELNFKKSYRIESASSFTAKDSIIVTFSVIDYNNVPTLGLDINILPLNQKLVTNEKGFAKIKLKKSDKIVQGNTWYLGYVNAYFSIKLNKNQDVKIFINEKNNELVKIQNDTLNLVSIKKDYFKVKNKNGSITIWKKITNK